MDAGLGVFSVSAYGLCVGLSALAGFLMLWMSGEKEKPDALTLSLYVIPFALIGARLLFCLVQYEALFLDVGPQFLFQTWHGGFLLWGALLGGACGAWLAARHQKTEVAKTLDRLVCPTLLVIAICRLAEFFTLEGRGYWLMEDSFFCRFPFAVRNEYGEWQLAVFVWEAAAALLILFFCWRHNGKSGDRTLVMLICYSACQIIFESLRMDSTPRFGFVRASQLFAGIVLALGVAVRIYREYGIKPAVYRGLCVLACIGVVVGMEFAIDKSPLPLPVCYAIMVAAMVFSLLLAFIPKGQHRLPHSQ